MADPLRDQLVRLLDWQEAHVGFDKAVEALPFKLQGVVPPGFVHSAWQLLEHLRIAQQDILDFCVNTDYVHKRWPNDYWPSSPAPPDADAWARSVAAYNADLNRMKALAEDPAVDLFATIPHGSGQTYLREILLVADHAAYHVGQLVLLRQALGCW
jgi:hypothetical protein